NGDRSLPTLCSWPSAKTRVRHIPSAPSCRARQFGQAHQSRFGECPPADRPPQDRVVRAKTYEDQPASHPIRFVAQPEYADRASPNRKQNALGKVPSRTRAPAALQKAVPQPVESLSVAPRRVCSFSLPVEKGATHCSRRRSPVQSRTAVAS